MGGSPRGFGEGKGPVSCPLAAFQRAGLGDSRAWVGGAGSVIKMGSARKAHVLGDHKYLAGPRGVAMQGL